ncbi:MAG TPA: hypothetical protein VHA37_07740 [Candidatus Saccharimonadales bacterium]|nr:hypothetical protein [Candidatus Saccharimonadales bacterium]
MAKKPTPEQSWKVRDAMDTLARAEQIRKDPRLMQDVRTLAKDLGRVVGRAPRKK